MTSQIHFEDLSVGQELPPLSKSVNTVNITMYIAAVWLMDRIHFDYPFSVERRGLPNIVAPGNMACDYYVQLLTDWAGESGALRKLSVQYRNFMVPGNTLSCGGKIVELRQDGDAGLAELELWIKNEDGKVCVPGKALVQLPRKQAA